MLRRLGKRFVVTIEKHFNSVVKRVCACPHRTVWIDYYATLLETNTCIACFSIGPHRLILGLVPCSRIRILNFPSAHFIIALFIVLIIDDSSCISQQKLIYTHTCRLGDHLSQRGIICCVNFAIMAFFSWWPPDSFV